MTSLPGNVLAGIAVELEQSILKPETFTETAKKLIETQLPKQNKALCAWIFNHVSHLIGHYDNNKLTGRICHYAYSLRITTSKLGVLNLARIICSYF